MDDTGLQAPPFPTSPTPPTPPVTPAIPTPATSMPPTEPFSPLPPTPPSTPMPPTPPEPPQPPTNQPIPEVQPETPQVAPPSSPVKKTFKKKGFKIIAGALMFMLLAGGAYMGITEVQKRQVVEQQAGKKGKTCEDLGSPAARKACRQATTGTTEPTTASQNNIVIQNGEYITSTGASQNNCDAGLWCEGCGGFCLTGTFSQGGCNKAQELKCGQKSVQGCSAEFQFACDTADADTDADDVCCNMEQYNAAGAGSIYLCTPAQYQARGICDANTPGVRILQNVPDCFCGVIQNDFSNNSHMSFSNSCGCNEEEALELAEASPSPSPSGSPSPSPSPSPTLSCIDLTSDEATPSAGDKVTFTCEANFSGMSPVAFFRYSSDNEATWSSAVPTSGVAIDATSHKASHDITIDKAGEWAVQCRVCSTAAATSCTTWGQTGI